jgi:hypothetical protein
MAQPRQLFSGAATVRKTFSSRLSFEGARHPRYGCFLRLDRDRHVELTCLSQVEGGHAEVTSALIDAGPDIPVCEHLCGREALREQGFTFSAVPALTVPLPLNAWQLRITSPSVVSEIDRLLDDHTYFEIASLLTSLACARGRTTPSRHGQSLGFGGNTV